MYSVSFDLLPSALSRPHPRARAHPLRRRTAADTAGRVAAAALLTLVLGVAGGKRAAATDASALDSAQTVRTASPTAPADAGFGVVPVPERAVAESAADAGGGPVSDGSVPEQASDAAATAPLEGPDHLETGSAEAPTGAPEALGSARPALSGVEADPSVAPLIEGPPPPPPEARALAPAERPRVLVKTILGILALLALAYLGGHPRVQAWEQRLRISQVITAGFPFVLLGMLARQPAVGILTDTVLAELGPVLRLGLGWIGFVVGFRFDVRLIGRLPSGAAAAVGIATAIPFAAVVCASALLLLAFDGFHGANFRDPVFVRDALILGTAGAMTGWTVTRTFPSRDAADKVQQMLRLEELAGVAGLAVVAAYFRPQGTEVAWQLPGTAWLFLTVGIGVTLGAVIYAVLHRTSQGPEFMVLTLGSISLTAGIAGYLHLSSVVVAFVAGVLLANFPGAYKERLRDTLHRLERPIYLMSLVVIGALWRAGDGLGWLLMGAFVVARLLGKWLGTELSARRGPFSLGPAERTALTIAPLGELSIAIVVSAQLLYPGGSVYRIVSAVIGGALLSELLLQLVWRRPAVATPPGPPPGPPRESLPPTLLVPATEDEERP
jgi:Kef-type K+ transport system membrane component KefB